MKGLKIVLPIMGVFLVLYVILVMMNSAKMNGIVSLINKDYDEDVIIVDTTMGNVLFDDYFDVTARSEKTGNLYPFTYKDGEVTGSYELENTFIQLSNEISQQLPSNTAVVPKANGLTEAPENMDDVKNMTFWVISSESLVEEDISMIIKDTYPSLEKVEIEIFELSDEQFKKMNDELLSYVPYSKIERNHIGSYVK